jgi:hypothetical protein
MADDLDDLIEGDERLGIRHKRHVLEKRMIAGKCPRCNGSGRWYGKGGKYRGICRYCNGTGKPR